ncbi:MAG: ParB/RepB/Spo0J family partition protein [Cyanobacteriota bacterium]|nr:ParB/RepB/Spo0J family partition protein [Cyanobacteriota bacterium]
MDNRPLDDRWFDKTGKIRYAPSDFKVLPVVSIVLPDYQPRQYFDDRKLDELTQAIARQGILSPLLVRLLPSGKYELIAGGRRFRAAQKAGMPEVPAIVLNLADDDILEVALLENLQREELNLLEETEGILALLALKLEIEVEEVPRLLHRLAKQQSRKTGSGNVTGQQEIETVSAVFKSLGTMAWSSFVRNRLPLLKLPPPLLDALRHDRLAYTKALAISKVRDRHGQIALLNRAIEQQLSLSQIRMQVRELNGARPDSAAISRIRYRLVNLQQTLEKSTVWQSDRKRKTLEQLLTQIEELIVD